MCTMMTGSQLLLLTGMPTCPVHLHLGQDDKVFSFQVSWPAKVTQILSFVQGTTENLALWDDGWSKGKVVLVPHS